MTQAMAQQWSWNTEWWSEEEGKEVAQRFSWNTAWWLQREIEEKGQPVTLSVQWLGKLLVVACEPDSGFIHLVQNPEECIAEYGPYHVSVAHWPTANVDTYNHLYNALHGRRVTLPITAVRNQGYMILGDCEVARLVRPYHQLGSYSDRDLHISG